MTLNGKKVKAGLGCMEQDPAPTIMSSSQCCTGVNQCGSEKETACETDLWKSLVCLNERFNVTKVADMGSGTGGRLAGDEAGKVAWSQIVKPPVNQAKEAGL